MISVLCPTRNRPDILQRMVVSIHETAIGKWDCVVYVDEDDKETQRVCREHEDAIKMVVGPRVILTDCWNRCLPKAEGNILMQANDDIIFRTKGWDLMVEGAFAQCPDKILMVHGNDMGMHNERFGPHPFVHRRWVEVAGYFIPPYFWSEFGDTWLNDVFNGVNRRKYVPADIEHMHYEFRKAPLDRTYQERLNKHATTNPAYTYGLKAEERSAQITKLAGLLGTPYGT